MILTLALACAAFASDALFSQGQSPANGRRIVMLDGREVVEGEVIVRYRDGISRVARDRAEIQADSNTSEPLGVSARRLRSRRLSTSELLATLRDHPDVEYVEPNYIIRANAVPNDPSFGSLWGLFNTAQVVNGTAGVAGEDISAPDAWNITTGSRANIVAVLDSGIDFAHPDLAANVFSAPRQFAVTVGGTQITCTAGTHGFNALNDSCLPIDDNGHGTHVSGIIGAVGNNGVGVTGVNWTANILALKVLDADGTGTTAAAVKAIDWVIKMKAALGADGNVRVLNASWGGATFSQALDDQIAAANNADVLFVASAGSDGQNNDVTPHHPASSTRSNVLSVAAVSNTGVLDADSNYGLTTVDLGAPGGALSTLPDNDYGELQGTSMAAPFVSGAAALVLSACPSGTALLIQRLMSSVDPLASLAGKTASGGRLNVGRAVENCISNSLQFTATPSGAVAPGATIFANVANGPALPPDFIGMYPAGGTLWTWIDWKYLNGLQTLPSSGIANATVPFKAPSTPGSYDLRLFSNSQQIGTVTFTVGTQPTVSINDVSVTEGNSGTVNATFTVTVAPVNPLQTVTVMYATANGTATSGSDYVAATGTATIPPGATSATISVTINGDSTAEANETFTVNLSNPVNATIGDAQGVATITNDDAAPGPTVSVSSTTVAPGALFNVTVSNGPARPPDFVGMYPAGGTLWTWIDWKYLNGSQTLPSSGIANATLPFTAPSTPGSYDLRFFSNSQLIGTVTITVGAGTQPTISINDVSVTEGNSGTATATFTVTVAPVNPSQTVTVNYATANGTATSGSDYVAATGTATIPPGASSATISVTINGDSTAEANETFTVNLSGPTNASVADGQGIGTITNDDGTAGPTVSVSATTVAPGALFNVTVSNGPARPPDFVGMYPAGGTLWTWIDWKYLNGSQTLPSSGIANATLVFTAPSTPGSYDLRFFSNGQLVGSVTVTVGTQSAPGPAVSVSSTTVAPGALFNVTVSNGPARPPDFVGMYPAGGTLWTWIDWKYLNALQTLPSSGIANATLVFTAPSTPGSYDLRFFSNGQLLGTVTITVP